MLARILATFRDAGRPCAPADLSRELGIDEAALLGMLDTLVARGRLRRIDAADDHCGGCPIRSGCFIMSSPVARTYALIADSAPTADRVAPDPCLGLRHGGQASPC